MKNLSTAAQAAKLIRKELKQAFPEVKFSVRSKTYSMGSSIDVDYTDMLDEREVEKVVNKYQYGSFDGMTDMYNCDNSIEGLPQVKYTFVNQTIPTDMQVKILDVFNKKMAENYNIEYSVEGDNVLFQRNNMDNLELYYKFQRDVIRGEEQL